MHIVCQTKSGPQFHLPHPTIGDRWFNLLNGKEYTWTSDINSQQWVDTRTSGYYGPPGIQGTDGYIGSDGAQGIQGIQGVAGTGITILGSYSDEASLFAAHPTGNIGDAYLIGGYLYVWA